MSILTMLWLALAVAQEPAQPPAAAPPNPPREQAPPSSGYTYDAQGRRDPFVSLVVRGTVADSLGPRAAGVPGLLVSEVAVRGIIRSRTEFIAMIQSGNGKTYIVHDGDRLLDGAVKSIAQDQVVFSQEVDDPASRVKRRDVAKRVRAVEVPEGPATSRDPDR